ncbi:MAG: AI-2E family transporter YdiK [Rubrivivax sp.]|nr:AI-2E family transporter YdiK [Rubrivivax sp.]
MSEARQPAGRDLARTTFAVLCIGVLIGVSLWILRPFLGPAIWAAMVVVASWPLMRRVQDRLWGRRSLAVVVMTLALLLLFVAPLTAAILTLVGNVDRIVGAATAVTTYRPAALPPAWLAGLPYVGASIVDAWQQVIAAGPQALLAKLAPYAGSVTKWFVAEVGGLGVLLLQFLLTVIIAAVMYAHGEEAAAIAKRFARRVAGAQGEGAVQLAGNAIRGVAMGVGVTALVQAVLGGLGLWAAGVPFAGLLTALMFILCIAQIGALPVLVPAALWMFWGDQTAWGVLLLVWSGIVGTLDNVLRPILIRRGADLPLLLIFSGVIGGLLAFGLVGIFVGPVLLAVGWTLLDAWMSDDGLLTEHPPEPPGPPPAA